MLWPLHVGPSLALLNREEYPEVLMLKTITQAVKQGFFPATKPEVIPTSMDLGGHFEKFVKYWADPEFQYRGPIQDDLPGMSSEVSIRWKGEVGGRIVIRCHPKFLRWLEESRDTKPSHMQTETEIFREMSSLYAVYLIYCFWMSDFSEMGMIQPNPSTPADWPVRKPSATCSLLVQNNPVEIRLWVGAASF
jgi:hypothetical protein